MRREIRRHPLGVTSTEKLGENCSRFAFYGKLYTALKPAHKDKSWRRLMWPRPIFVLHRPSVYVRSSPYFHSWVHLLCLFRSVQQLPLLQSCPCFQSTPPPTLPSLCALFSFIHILLPQQRQTQSSHRAGALPHYNLSPFFYLHSSCFASSGDFTFISSSFTLNSSLPPFLCVGAFLSLLFFPLAHVRLIALPLLLLPNSLSTVSLFLALSLPVLRLSVFSPQSLVMRCDKPLPCYHSNRFPLATQRQWWWGVRRPRLSTKRL